MPDAPIENTLCALLHRSGISFVSDDTSRDPRVCQVPSLKGTAVASYCGVMLRDSEGEPIGSLCHFDTRPCDVAHGEGDVLEQVARMLEEDGSVAEWGPGPAQASPAREAGA